jgi:hypothetical protein
MRIFGKKLETFYHIDLKIIMFEGRKRGSFIPYLAGSTDFDSCWSQKLNFTNLRFLRFMMCGMCGCCGKNLRCMGRM